MNTEDPIAIADYSQLCYLQLSDTGRRVRRVESGVVGWSGAGSVLYSVALSKVVVVVVYTCFKEHLLTCHNSAC